MAKLTKKDLDKLPDSMFGIPETRSYPLVDEEHVRKAIQFFKYAEKKYRKELAKNINRRAKELKMKIHISKNSAFYPYADKAILATEEDKKTKKATSVKEFNMYMLAPNVGYRTTVDEHPVNTIFSEDGSFADDPKGIITTLDKIHSANKDDEEYVKVARESLRCVNDVDAAYEYAIFEGLCEMKYMQHHYIPDEQKCCYQDNDEVLGERMMHRLHQAVLAKQVDAVSIEVLVKHIANIASAVIRAKIISFICACGAFTPNYCNKFDQALSKHAVNRMVKIDPEVQNIIHFPIDHEDEPDDATELATPTESTINNDLSEVPLDALTEGASIDAIGNISFSFVSEGSWITKLNNMIQPLNELKIRIDSEEERNDPNKWEADMDLLKKGLCVIFALGATLRQNYIANIDIDKDSLDYIDAEKAYNNAVAHFKSLLAFITATHRDFVFIPYYINNNFFEKINIPEVHTPTDLTNLYYFFIR